MYIQYVDVFTLVHTQTCVRQLSTLNTFARRVPVSVRLLKNRDRRSWDNSMTKMTCWWRWKFIYKFCYKWKRSLEEIFLNKYERNNFAKRRRKFRWCWCVWLGMSYTVSMPSTRGHDPKCLGSKESQRTQENEIQETSVAFFALKSLHLASVCVTNYRLTSKNCRKKWFAWFGVSNANVICCLHKTYYYYY